MATRAKSEASFASIRLTRRNYSGPSLLSQVGGRKVRKDSKYGNGTVEEGPEKKVYEPATDDEPLSSSDETESSAASSERRALTPLRSTGNKGNQAVRKTLEEKLAEDDAATGPAEDNKTPTRKNGRKTVAESPREGSRKSARQSASVQQQRQSPKRTLSDLIYDEDEDADEDELFPSFMSSSQSYKRRKNVGYGGLKNIHAASSFKVPSSSLLDSSQPEIPSPGFKKPMDTPILEDRAKEVPTDHEDNGFKVPMEIDIASPLSKTRTQGKTERKGANNNSKPTFKMPSGSDDHDVTDRSSQRKGFKQPLSLPNDSISSSSLATSSAKDRLFDLDDGSSLSPLSSASSNFSMELSQEEKTALAAEATSEPAPASESVCPMCKQPVEPELLTEFLAQPKQRVREQQRFCESHKKRSAEQEWREKGYPTIDWGGFDERIQGHFAALENILAPDCSSYYRNILDTTMKAGKAKNFRLTFTGDGLENLSCGYYGSKGAGRMLHAVTTRFSKKLRRLAATDHLIKTAGVASYAQAVLVPELTVLLVKEDMGVTDADARQILRETIDIGERLNFAPNDVVPIPGGDDDMEFSA